MDIKIPVELLAGRTATSQPMDLVAQLKAAGTVEAQVLRVIEGQLLLSSRLGEILTRNSLNFKAGDRLLLRLTGSEQNPLLKVSRPTLKSIAIDSRQAPALSRSLPAERPVLAQVTRVTAQSSEIKLADGIQQLPRPPMLAKGQLLSLQRRDDRGRIEVTPLDRKVFYKAILKQLIPQQAGNPSSSLIKLLNLVAAVVNRPEAALAPAANAAKTPVPDHSGSAPGPGKPAETPQSPVSDARRQPPAWNKDSSRALATRPAPAAELLQATKAAAPAHPRGSRPLTAAGPVASAPPVAGKQSSKPDGAGSAPTKTANADSTPNAKSASGVTKPGDTATITRQGFPSQAGSTPMSTPHRAAGSAGGPASAATVAKPEPVAASSGSSPAKTSLHLLSQLVPRLAEIDARQIRQWFAHAGLIKPGESGYRPEPYKILQQLQDREFFSRELLQTLQLQPKPGDKPMPERPASAPEALLLQIREGVKLAEQGLAQNLLQRSSLGLQQESQQSLSFSMALPFLEEQQVKPLSINLAERHSTANTEERSWDIRLSFELADLGPVSVHIVLSGNSVAASFYSLQPSTRARIDDALPQLRQQLISAGFEAGEFQSFAGAPAASQVTPTTVYTESLIDIEV